MCVLVDFLENPSLSTPLTCSRATSKLTHLEQILKAYLLSLILNYEFQIQNDDIDESNNDNYNNDE